MFTGLKVGLKQALAGAQLGLLTVIASLKIAAAVM